MENRGEVVSISYYPMSGVYSRWLASEYTGKVPLAPGYLVEKSECDSGKNVEGVSVVYYDSTETWLCRSLWTAIRSDPIHWRGAPS